MSDLYREPRTWEDVKDSCGLDDEDTIKELASINFEFFLEHVLGFNVESELIQYLINITQNPPEQGDNKATKIAVEAPRGHSKTYTGTIGRSLHVAYTEKRSEIVIVAGSREQSTDILADIKTIISNNEVLQHLEPTVDRVEKLQTDIEKWERTWAAKSITTTTSVQIRTKPFGSTIRGKHIDYLFADDLLSDESSGHRTRRAEKDMFYNIISPIAENSEGVLQIVGTPQDHNDLMEELLDKPSYESRKFNALHEDGSVLWPYMWTKEQLQAKREEIGPSRFMSEYQCEPMSPEEQFFPENMVREAIDAEGRFWKMNPKEGWNYYVGGDIAMSDDRSADYTVFKILGSPPDEDRYYEVDMYRKKGLGPQQIIDRLEELDSRYHFTGGLIERNAIGYGVWRNMENKAIANRVEAFDTTRKTRPTILSELQAALDRRQLALHQDQTTIDELLAFKKRSGKLKGKDHDDTVLALAMAWHAVEDKQSTPVTMSIISGDRDDDIDLFDDRSGDDDDIEIGII